MIRSLKNYYHFGKALLANLYYKFPSHKLTVVGVTGTDGKTTTSTLIYHILNESGRKTLLISTIGAYMYGKHFETGLHTTTPSSFAIQKLLRKAVNEGCTHAVLEITSHALDQKRAWGIPFAAGIITNVTREHLDYHKTHAKYIRAKRKLLDRSQVAIVNSDDSSYEILKKAIPETKLLTYSLHDKKASITCDKFPFKTKLMGDFNKQNILASILACQRLGLTDKEIRSAIATFDPPVGRQEIIYDKKFRVIVDFAHTPNAFLKVLPVIKETTEKRLIHVFGSAGERDKGKRPEMGAASSKFSDIIILTAEDPRHENVQKINEEIEKGIEGFTLIDSIVRDIKTGKSYLKISDRKEAIEYAISIAQKGDTILITGKGHEQSMNINGKEYPWDDRKEALSILKK